MADTQRPPGPDGVTTHDELAARLEELRAWAGVGYRELHRRVAAGRRARGIPEVPVFDTVRRALQPGRRRLDTELVVDVAAALVEDPTTVAAWRQACRVVTGSATVAGLVTVADRLPADPPGFAGRDAEVAAVLAALDAAASGVVVIEGMGGVGKTLLATRVAHLLAARGRRDVVWSVDLRGYDESLPAAAPAAVLDGFLWILGVPGSRIVRMDLAQRSAALRELTGDRRVLALLDNAGSADQVLPLLPGGRAVVLVTSRDRLALPGAAVVPLDVPGRGPALALLRTAAGGDRRIDAEPEAAERIVDLLGRLPLALGIVGARLRDTPDWTLADHAERLAEARAARQLDDRIAFALRLSYAALPAERRRLLRLLALHPGSSPDATAVAALAGVATCEAEAGLADLADAHLVSRPAGGRVALHDLVRTFAVARAHDEESPSARRAAVGRLLDHYLRTALAAARRQSPETAAWLPAPPDGDAVPACPADPGRWLAEELPDLVAAAVHAADHGLGEVAVGLSLALYRTLDIGARYAEAERLHAQAVPFAEGVTQGRVMTALGTTYLAQGRFADAEPWLRQARDVYRAAGDVGSESAALTNLGIVLKETGRADEALASFETALTLAVAAGDTARRLRTLGNLGQLLGRLGRDDDALVHLEEAHVLAGELGDTAREAQTLSLLGDQLRRMERHADALVHLDRAARLARASGFDYGTPYVLSSLASVQAVTGEHAAAEANFARALDAARRHGLGQAEVDVLLDLADALTRGARYAEAATRYREAAELAGRLWSTASRERALAGLARADRHAPAP